MNFAHFIKKVFESRYKYFDIETIIKPLKKYIIFQYQSDMELYWLAIIALNLAQDDLKENSIPLDLNEVLNILTENN